MSGSGVSPPWKSIISTAIQECLPSGTELKHILTTEEGATLATMEVFITRRPHDHGILEERFNIYTDEYASKLMLEQLEDTIAYCSPAFIATLLEEKGVVEKDVEALFKRDPDCSVFLAKVIGKERLLKALTTDEMDDDGKAFLLGSYDGKFYKIGGFCMVKIDEELVKVRNLKGVGW